MKLKCFFNEVVCAKIKTKAFWHFVNGYGNKKAYPAQIINPTNKSELLETRHEIHEALVSHFGNIGKDSTITPLDNEGIRTELDNIAANMHQSTDMCSLHLKRSKIFKHIENLKNGKSCGIDYIHK